MKQVDFKIRKKKPAASDSIEELKSEENDQSKEESEQIMVEDQQKENKIEPSEASEVKRPVSSKAQEKQARRMTKI